MKNRRLNAKVLVLAILFAGTLFTWWTAVRTDREMRSDLLVQTRLVTKSLNIARIQALSGTTKDLKTPDYQRIKEQITDVRSANPQCRFVHLIGRKTDGQIFFFADSEPTVSNNSALPGQAYKNAPAGYRRVFDTKTEVVEGPVTDNRGTWVLALVPISHPQTGAVLAVLGMDIDARTWKWNMVARSALPVGMMLILLIGMTAVFFYIRRTDAGIRSRQAALRESEEQFKQLAEVFPETIFEANMKGDVTYANEHGINHFGLTQEDVSKGINIYDMISPRDRKLVLERLQSRIQGTNKGYLEYQAMKKDGSTFDALALSVPIMVDGAQVGIRGFILDITKRKQAEKALKHNEAFLNTLLNAIPIPVFYKDREGRYTGFNRAFETFFGATKEQLVGKTVFDINPPELAKIYHAQDNELFESGVTQHYESQVKNTRGITRDVIFNKAVFTDSQGNVNGLIGAILDVTEQKQAQEKLKERFKELTCLYSLSALIESPGISLEEILKKTVMFLSQAWQFPEITEASIELEGQFFHTAQFRETPWVMEQTITVSGKPVGKMKVCYVEERPASDEGTFLIEERQLIKTVAERIGHVVERIRAEDELRESEERIHSITNSAHEAIMMMDNNGGISYWNPAAERILGYTKEESIGKNLHKLITPERFLSAHLAAFPEFQKTGQGNAIGKTLELVARRKDGREIDVALSLSAVKIKGAWHAIGILQDIAERKKMEAELRESEEKYRTILEGMDDVYFELDIKGNITFVNPSSCKMSGYSEEELLGMSFKKISTPGDIEKVIQYFGEIFLTDKTGKPFLWNLEKKNGEQGFFELVASPIRDKQGKPIGFRGIGRDVTERMKAEEELRQSEEKFRNIIENIQDGYIDVDLAGNWIFVNDAVVEYTLYSREELIGMHYSKLQTEKSIKDTFKIFNEIYKTGKPVKAVAIEGLRKDGTIGYYEFSISLNKNSNGKPIGFHCISRDITKRKKAEKELLDLNQELESVLAEANYLTVQADQANAAKSDFLANMSHEIRTPMNAIIGMADLLWDSQLTTEQRQYVQIFRSAGENLLILINDILDLSKVESGQLVLENMSYDLFDIVDKTCEVIALRAHGRNLELLCHINPDVPQNIHGDPTRLRQVLMNLLGNAVKFTEKGEIVLTVLSLPQDVSEKTPRCLQFSVRDTGIGIPADKLNIVFEKFTQSDNSITRKYEGTGLGLAISKQFIELMGGKIRVESRQGEGSTFFFTIPLEEAPPEKNQKPAFGQEVGLQGVNILIVDDNATNRLILRETLTLWGCIVTEASGGAAGLKELEKAKETGHPFRIAILDSQMPEMDGLTLARKIRGKPDFVALSILMLTSERRSRDRIKAKAADITGYLIKPVKRDALRNALRVAMGREEILRKPQKPPEESPAEDLRPLRILLVEDSEDNRFLVQAYLKNTKYLIDTAGNGQVAVEKFMSNVYDLILMDVQMPVMDGYMATREIRRIEREEGRKPSPIVALTAHALKEDKEKSLEIGFDDYLTKPIRKPVLLEAIQKITSKEKDE